MSKSWNQKPDGHKPIRRKSDEDDWKRKVNHEEDDDE